MQGFGRYHTVYHTCKEWRLLLVEGNFGGLRAALLHSQSPRAFNRRAPSIRATGRGLMGNSQSQQQLDETKSQLAAEKKRSAQLADEKAQLSASLAREQQKLAEQQRAHDEALESSRQEVQQKQEALAYAMKRQEIAEGLRRSDALLAKRLLDAQLRLGAEEYAAVDPVTKAAAMALSVHDERELREMLALQTSDLEALKRRAAELEREAMAARQGALTRELWVPSSPCDSCVSVAVRSSRGIGIGGFRVKPFSPTPVSPMLGFLYQSAELDHPRWAAMGGSLLLAQGELAVRAGVCAQPAPNQQVAVSFDHNLLSERQTDAPAQTGLSFSYKTRRDTLTARLFGTIDLTEGPKQTRSGLEIIYDM